MTPALRPLGAVGVALAVGLAGAAAAGDWLHFRGDVANTGTANEPITAPLRLRWSRSQGGWCGNVVARAGVVYVGSSTNFSGGVSSVRAYNLATGAPVWSVTHQTGCVTPPHLATDGTYLYANGCGLVRAYNLASGALVWSNSIGGTSNGPLSSAGGSVYAFWQASSTGVVKINAGTGNSQWGWSTAATWYMKSAPALGGGRAFVGGAGTWYAVNDTAGTTAWSYATGAGYISTSPALANGNMYGLAEDGRVYALNESTGAKAWDTLVGTARYNSVAVSGTTVYVATETGTLRALNAVTGAIQWTTTLTAAAWGCGPTVANGLVFVATIQSPSVLHAIDAQTGAFRWSTTLTGAVAYIGLNYSDVAIADGAIMIGDEGGTLSVFEPVAVPPVTAVAAAKTVTPASPTPAQSVTYRIVVTNAGTATISDLVIVDTVPTLVSVSFFDQPAGVTGPVVTSVGGTGTRFEWTGTGLSLVPGASLSFTITGTTGCGPATVTNRAAVGVASAAGAAGAVTNAATFVLASCPSMTATGWLHYRGDPANTGVAADPVTAPLRLRWSRTQGGACGSTVILNGIIYVGSMDGAMNTRVRAYDVMTGGLKWEVLQQTGCGGVPHLATDGAYLYVNGCNMARAYTLNGGALVWTNSLAGTSGGPITAAGGRVYAFFQSAGAGVVGINSLTGNADWGNAFSWYMKSAPAVAGGRVFAGGAGSWYGLAAATGAGAWSPYATGAVYISTSPALANGLMYGLAEDGVVYALDQAAGTKTWSTGVGGARYGSVAATAAAVYVATETGQLLRKLDASTGAILWTTTLGGEVWSSGVTVANGLVFVATNQNPSRLIATDAQTGAHVWSTTLTGTIGAVTYQEAAIACGVVAIGDEAGSLLVFEPAPAAPPPPPTDDKTVKIVGGVRGYLDAKKGEQAVILVKPKATGTVTVRIYNLRGDLIRVLVADTGAGAATTVLRWDATDSTGAKVPPGAYPILVEGPGFTYRDTLAVLR